MAKLFRFYDDWEKEVFTCPVCGWQGTFDDGLVEMYEELMDSSCPECEYISTPMLAIVSWPTIEESENNWDKVSEIDKIMVKQRKRFLAELDRMSLRSAAGLPDLEGSSIVITWDFIDEGGDKFTLVRHGERKLWQEPAVYEGADRFAEVVEMLKGRYGSQLADVVPTRESWTFLYGDQLGSMGAVERVRESIRKR